MEFLTPGEKLKRLRIKFNIEQKILEKAGVTRNFVSMVENNKRKLGRVTALKIAQIFNEKAAEIGAVLNLDASYFLAEPEDDAKKYCLERLKNCKSHTDIDEIKTIIEEYKLWDIKPEFYLGEADVNFDDKDYERAFIHYLDALQGYTERKDESRMAYIYNRLGYCRDCRLDYSEALSYYFKSYESSLTNKSSNLVVMSLFNIARAYKKNNQIDDSLYYIGKCIESCDISENFNDYVKSLILKANCYVELEDNHKAINIYNEILELFKNDYENPHLGFIYNNLGDIYLDMGNFRKALEFFNKAHSFRKLHDPSSVPHTLIDKAKVYADQRLFNEAEKLIYEGIELAKQLKDDECLFKGYTLLEKVYENKEDKEKLKIVYINMLNLLDNKSFREKILETNIKLSILSMDNGNINESKDYLLKAINK